MVHEVTGTIASGNRLYFSLPPGAKPGEAIHVAGKAPGATATRPRHVKVNLVVPEGYVDGTTLTCPVPPIKRRVRSNKPDSFQGSTEDWKRLGADKQHAIRSQKATKQKQPSLGPQQENVDPQVSARFLWYFAVCLPAKTTDAYVLAGKQEHTC